MRESESDDFIDRVFDHPIRYLFKGAGLLLAIYGATVVAGIVTLPFTAVDNATTVARRIIDPDNALQQYRWFHDADARLKVFPAQIKAARVNLAYAEKNAPERSSSRMTELTGITQVCETLVADYNSRAQRLDAGFFRNPERWLPVATAPWEPLPQGYTATFCEGVNP